jgi:hypothetical protein
MSGYKVLLYVDEKSLLQNLQKGGFKDAEVPNCMTLGSFHWVFFKVHDKDALSLWNSARNCLSLTTAGQEKVYKWGPDADTGNNRILGEFIIANNVPCHFVIKYLY